MMQVSHAEVSLDDFVDYPDIIANLQTVGVLIVDRHFNIMVWNRFMELNSFMRSEDVLGKNLFDVFPEINRNWLEKKVKSCLLLNTHSFSSWRQRPYLLRFKASKSAMGQAEYMFQDISFFPVRDHNGAVYGACILFNDVTELAEATRMLEQTVDQMLNLDESNRRDGLTGLYNRKYFDEQITQDIMSAHRYGLPLVLAMMDIDHFKTINDTYGHDGGDAVLRALSLNMKDIVRSTDSLCRYGGEEFVLIMSHIQLQDALIILDRLHQKVQNMVVKLNTGEQVSITISVGYAELQEGMTSGQLVRQADEALYAAKRLGRNRIASHGEASL